MQMGGEDKSNYYTEPGRVKQLRPNQGVITKASCLFYNFSNRDNGPASLAGPVTYKFDTR